MVCVLLVLSFAAGWWCHDYIMEVPGDGAAARGNTRLRPAHCSNGIFSLMEAAAAGREKLVRKRLKQGYNINDRNEMGRTPLHLAVLGRHGAVVKLLLREGADALAKDKEGRTPAELTKDGGVLKMLREAEARRGRELEVFVQLRMGNDAPLKKELTEGMSPNCVDGEGKSCLLADAAEKGNAEAVKVLLKAGARTNLQRGDGKTPLHLAAGVGNVEVVRALLEAGADPWAEAGNGATALHEAVWYAKTEVVKELLPWYKERNFSPHGGWSGTPVAMAIDKGRVDILREMLRAGLRVNDPMFAEEPLLVRAAKKQSEEMVKLLLDAGADKGAKDAGGRCAADYANDSLKQILR